MGGEQVRIFALNIASFTLAQDYRLYQAKNLKVRSTCTVYLLTTG